MRSTSLSRRRFLASTLVSAAALPVTQLALAEDTCVLIAEQEQGPFYVASELVRSKIAEDKPGIPLRLRLIVLNSVTCRPLPNAAIDLWHCDAQGLYSGYTSNKGMGGPGGPGGRPPGPPPAGFDPSQAGPPPGFGPGGPGGPGGGNPTPTDKLTFLRGIQITDAEGAVAFETIFPGFYEGRTNHIHFKVRLDGHLDSRTGGKTYAAGHTSHTGQLFFPEDLNVKLMSQPPYTEHKIHRTTQAEDNVFTRQHGSMALATLIPVDPNNHAAGLIAELRVAVDPNATPKNIGPGAPIPGQ